MALCYKSRVLIQQVQEATAVDILRVMKEDSDAKCCRYMDKGDGTYVGCFGDQGSP